MVDLLMKDDSGQENTHFRLSLPFFVLSMLSHSTNVYTLFFRSMFGSSRISSQSTIESLNEEIEDTFSKWEMPISFPGSEGNLHCLISATSLMLPYVNSNYIYRS